MKNKSVILFEVTDIKGKHRFYSFDEKMVRKQYKSLFPKGKIISIKIIPAVKFKHKKK